MKDVKVTLVCQECNNVVLKCFTCKGLTVPNAEFKCAAHEHFHAQCCTRQVPEKAMFTLGRAAEVMR